MSKEDSRKILVKTMQSALQSKGLHGVGLSEILKTAGLPKGSLYYHFPGGRKNWRWLPLPTPSRRCAVSGAGVCPLR
ncbi:TetR/AcrR family transcriptional regulator [Halopseudomonas pachastrellae]|nr:TetR/AcrR family transcriptional regulator [Halopseudomonas pachastrellae]